LWLIAIGIIAALGFSQTKLYRMFFYSDKKLKEIYELWNQHIKANSPEQYKYLVGAVIAIESGGKSEAVSYSNAIGLMQITKIVLDEYNKVTGSKLSVSDLTNPNVNIQVGVWYIDRLINYYDFDVFNAMRAYNAGIGSARKDGNIADDYAVKVLAYAQRLAIIT
jgi:soluble lytic murein transglycosylase-like protein